MESKLFRKTSLNGSAVTNAVLDNHLICSLTCSFNKPIPDKSIYVGLFKNENSSIQLRRRLRLY